VPLSLNLCNGFLALEILEKVLEAKAEA